MISPHWVEEWQKIISLYQDDQTVGAFFSHVFTVDINNNTLMVFKLFPLRPPQRLLKPVENFQELWKRNFCALPASGGLVLRKAVFAKLGKYQASYGTETDIALVLKLLNNYAVVFTSQYLYAYRIHSFQTFDREKMSKTFDKKFSVLQRNLDIFKDFYEKELCCGFKAPEFYKRVAFMYIAISFHYFLALKPRIAKKYFQLTLEKIPDLFNSMSDYYEAWSVFLHYLKVMLYGKLRAVFCYRAIAKDWGS
jgi:hypothetical protein